MIKTNAENGSGFESRPYQQKGIGSLVNFTKDIVRGNLLNNKEDFEEKYSERGYYETAGLVHMATGTGKTYTVGSALKKILKMRNRFNRLYPDKPFPRLNIVLFTHLIDLVNQFRDDLTKGRKNPAIFDDEIRENLKVVTYHSKADSGNQTEEMETETFTQTNGRQYDKLICSTFQTAAIPGKLDDENDIDIILVDEGHHLADGNNYNTVLEKFYNKGRDGKTPVLIVMTATPNNQTIDLVGESIFHFSLPEYLASPYSPPIDYNLVTNENVTEDEISDLETQRDMIRNIEDIKEKKELLRILKGRMDEFLSRFRTSKDLVENLLKKIGWEKAEATIVFCPSIEIADEVAEIINSKISGIGTEKFAHSYHSRNDANKALDQLDNPNNPCKIIIVVDKVNEGIDMPNIKNVVLWRGTNSPTIFFQQFGRGLRGSDKINVYDYVGGMTNFAWINGIYNDYKKFRGEIEDQNDGDTGESGDRNTKFHLIGGDFSGSQIHKLN
ncbi:MAG: DEAD/DEAH box helicase family protein, partial [Candidatus Gracilibacteria bacterium]|nr:DEAD/DEAH box helicase family protein [Candidatus Gracilibacteria bacterium]